VYVAQREIKEKVNIYVIFSQNEENAGKWIAFRSSKQLPYKSKVVVTVGPGVRSSVLLLLIY
jgi:hypothetical protein